MPGLTARKRPAVSLVQDQDIVLTIEAGLSDLIITIIGAVDEDGVKHVTDLLVSLDICTKSPYLKALLEASEDKTELTFGGDAKSNYDGENKEGTLLWIAHLHELPEQRLEELGLFKVSFVGVWHAISPWDTHQEGKIQKTL